MFSRRLMIAVFALAALLFVVPANNYAQAPKKDEPKSAIGKDGSGPEVKAFKTADGVKLRGLFYKSTRGSAGPVVVLIPDSTQDPNETVWHTTANYLAQNGFNVFRFAYRGRGTLRSDMHGLDVVPEEFWVNPINRNMVKGVEKAATKTMIKWDPNPGKSDFRNGYFPMLVQDLVAVRNELDRMNDNFEVNTSSIYLIGAGDAVNLGFLLIASEWLRDRRKPDLITPFQLSNMIVSPRSPALFGGEPAGLDYGGAIWLSPVRMTGFSDQVIKSWIFSSFGIRMRTETPMLVMYDEKDPRGKLASNVIINNVLMVNAKVGPNGERILPPAQTRSFTVKGPGVTGSKLLGNKLGTEETILEYLSAVEKERKGRTRAERGWPRPIYVDVTAFGL